MNRLKDKFSGSFIRVKDACAFFPKRIKRLVYHFLNAFQFQYSYIYISITMWWSELLYLLLDLFAIPELYETFQEFFKYNTRKLSPLEIKMAKTIFGDSINYARVRIDEKAQIGCRHWHFLYVSFYTINAWGAFREDLLIHELAHVWQFQHFGGVYIPRAIKAMNSEEGYNYGGIQKLKAQLRLGKTIFDFNYEQQADIITDYFRLKNGVSPQWGSATQSDLWVYKEMCEVLKNYSTPNNGTKQKDKA